mgnify:FL=1
MVINVDGSYGLVSFCANMPETYPVDGNNEGYQNTTYHPVPTTSTSGKDLGFLGGKAFRCFRHGDGKKLSL